MTKRIILFLIALAVFTAGPAPAQEGRFARDLCTEITAPVANKTWCFERTGADAGKLKAWNGSAWVVSGGDTLPVSDTTAIVKGSADDTKKVRIEADGLTTGQTRVLTPLDKDYTLEETGHAAKHKVGGSDPVSTTTPGANSIPETDGSGVLATGWINQAGNYNFTGTLITVTTVASLGTATLDVLKIVTDGNPGCGTGSGSTVALCRGNGTTWDTAGSLDHGLFSGLGDDDHIQYTLAFTSAGAPSAGSCTTDREIIVDTTNNELYFCSDGSGGNPRKAHAQSVAYTSVQGNTGSASPPAGGGALTIKGANTNHLSFVAADGSPDTVTGTVGAALTTKSITFRIGSDQGSVLADTDDEATVWRNNIAALTITEVWCESDGGTPIVNLQRDDGAPANILSSNLTCSTAGATGTIDTNEDNLAVGDKIDFVMVTAGGVAKRVTIGIKATVD